MTLGDALKHSDDQLIFRFLQPVQQQQLFQEHVATQGEVCDVSVVLLPPSDLHNKRFFDMLRHQFSIGQLSSQSRSLSGFNQW